MEGLWIEILTCAIVHPTETQQELAKEVVGYVVLVYEAGIVFNFASSLKNLKTEIGRLITSLKRETAGH